MMPDQQPMKKPDTAAAEGHGACDVGKHAGHRQAAAQGVAEKGSVGEKCRISGRVCDIVGTTRLDAQTMASMDNQRLADSP